MALKIFNTRTESIQVFEPVDVREIKMYVCGPTTYSSPHIGHAMSYIFFDVLARYLRFNGFRVKYVQNITDMGKNIKKVADETGTTLSEVVDKYEAEYLNAMTALNVESVDVYERSSNNLERIINQIERILAKKHAYPVVNGVFYDTAQQDFGALSHTSKNELVSTEDYEGKRTLQDFSLWKRDLSWGIEMDSPYGRGRPHWHILDTALAEKYFGGCIYDIHGAGADCIYPHHEAIRSILQSLSGEAEPVRFWIHNASLNRGSQKMSKSLGNYKSLSSLLQKYDPAAVRLSLLSYHYMKPIEFNEGVLSQWQSKLKTFELVVEKLRTHVTNNRQDGNYGIFSSYFHTFVDSMNENVNTYLAVETVLSFFEND